MRYIIKRVKIMTTDRHLRILLMGDASNYHRCLAVGLRRMGHDVTVASDGSRWMDTARDIDISRRPGRLGGLMFWIDLWRRRRLFAGYDIVQLCGTGFISQRPGRIAEFFDYLVRNNGEVYMTAIGTDSYYVSDCLSSDPALRYSEWMVDGTPTAHRQASEAEVSQWFAPEMMTLCRHIYDNVAGISTVLYEYDLTVRRAAPEGKRIVYTGIPIDMASVTPVDFQHDIDRVRLFMGAHSYRMVEKGTDRMLAAARRVEARHPDRCVVDVVKDLPYEQYIQRMRSAHLVMDQLYSYTPATNALLAMAMGIPTMSGGEDEYYDFIGERSLRPIVNAIPDDRLLEQAIEDVVMDPSQLCRRSAEGIELVRRHNDTDVVARKYMELWQR